MTLKTQNAIMTLTKFYIFLAIMTLVAIIVFFALFRVSPGYGLFVSKKWGKTVSIRAGWIIMEAPVFIAMAVLWILSTRRFSPTPLVFFLLFEAHYLQRSFIFPSLLRSNSPMPLSIIAMGITFNVLNALMQGGWIFYLSPETLYTVEWLRSPQFIAGTIMFVGGMSINIQSDQIIRDLRHGPEDRRHYIPYGGMFRYISSANYFGELVEWIGFAVLTWSWSGAVFAFWTFANLAPRAAAIRKHYEEEFGDEFRKLKRKRILPFIY